MGASLSTLGGWTIVLCIAGYYAFRYMDDGKRREIARAAAQQKKRLEERHAPQAPKENKGKGKRARGESSVRDAEDSKSKQRPAAQKQPLATTTNQKVDYSTDDGADNREFAKQLASIKQGTNFAGPKKSDEKKQKSVKQSRAQERETAAPGTTKVSAPSSTTGADADDDQSPIASPEFTAVDSRDVSDMLEQPTSSGPSVLRLTDTDKIKQKEKKAKVVESKETKKQRQNKAKAEAARLAREADEAARKVKLEAQRRTARISEGRAAKDGSTFTNASQPKSSVWTAANGVNGTNGTSSLGSNSEFIPVQPLDTFDTANQTDVSKASGTSVSKSSDNWVSSLPSEEEQMSLLRDEENWSTVKSKKPRRKTKENVASDSNSVSNDTSSVTSSVTKPQQAAPSAQKPIVTAERTKPVGGRANGRPTGTFAQQSSFAALGGNDGPEEQEREQEWDV
jgi:hypothetical protein